MKFEGVRVLLWNRYGKQKYLVKSKKHTLAEILDIIAYIQKVNDEACSSFIMSVYDICNILVSCFEFEFKNVNYYEMTTSQIKQVLGKVKSLNYFSMNKNLRKPANGVFLIELTAFWELYNGQSIPKEVIEHGEIEEIIKATVMNNPDVQLLMALINEEGKSVSQI